MRIKYLRVRNFTSLVDVELSAIPDLAVFIGKNSSGKSNLIDALALLFTEFGNRINRDIGPIDEYHHLFPNHNTQTDQPISIQVRLTLTPEEWRDLLSIEQGMVEKFKQKELHLEKQLVNIAGIAQWTTQTVAIGDNAIVKDSEPSDEYLSLLDATSDDLLDIIERSTVTVDEILTRLDNTLRSSFNAVRTTDSPRSRPNRFAERPTVIDVELVKYLWERSQSKGTQRLPWTKVALQYEKMAPNQQRPAGVSSSIQMAEGTLSIPLGMTGEGSQALLRLVDQLERSPSIIAIEEPETHLHPALIRKPGQLFAETVNRDKQLFVCTHSPFLVEQSMLSSFFVVKRQDEGTEVSPVRSVDTLRKLLFDIGMRPSDVLFSDAILLIEGLSGEIFLNNLSNKLNIPLAGCGKRTRRTDVVDGASSRPTISVIL